jgi:hypothetical protein
MAATCSGVAHGRSGRGGAVVQPEINLLVSPLPERLFVVEPDDAPGWELPAEGDPV